MPRWCDNRIVVDVEYPIGRVDPPPHEHIAVDHQFCAGVIAQGLHLELVVPIQKFTIAALIRFISVDVKPTILVYVTEAEVIASHCGVLTTVESDSVRSSELIPNEC